MHCGNNYIQVKLTCNCRFPNYKKYRTQLWSKLHVLSELKKLFHIHVILYGENKHLKNTSSKQTQTQNVHASPYKSWLQIKKHVMNI